MFNCYNQQFGFSRFEVWDGNTFKSRYSWTEAPPLYHSYSISDAGIAATDFNQRHILVARFGSAVWNPLDLETEEGKSELLCGALPTLVSDTSLVAVCRGISLISTDGQVLTLDLPERTFFLTNYRGKKIAVSQNRQIIAVSLDRIEIKKRFLAEDQVHRVSTCVVLCDLYLKKRILTVIVTPLPLPSSDYDFALSPDGSKLAVLNGRTVAMYSVSLK